MDHICRIDTKIPTGGTPPQMLFCYPYVFADLKALAGILMYPSLVDARLVCMSARSGGSSGSGSGSSGGRGSSGVSYGLQMH